MVTQASTSIPTSYKRDLDTFSFYHQPVNDANPHLPNFRAIKNRTGISPQDVSMGPSTWLASSSQMEYEALGEALSSDEDSLTSQVGMMLNPNDNVHQSLVGDQQFLEWPQWDAMDCRSVPIPRSSVRCIPPQPNDLGISWPGTHAQQYDLYEQGSQQPRSAGYDERAAGGALSNLQPPYPQLHNIINSTVSSATSASTLSRSHPCSLPPINTVSPYASSDSSSCSSSPLLTPEITIRTPITLHQPRPSRRIPIISLSELASACEDFPGSPKRTSTDQKPSQRLPPPLQINDFLTNCASMSSPHHSTFTSNPFRSQFVPEIKNTYTAPTYLVGEDSEEVVFCSCGCRESYTLSQN